MEARGVQEHVEVLGGYHQWLTPAIFLTEAPGLWPSESTQPRQLGFLPWACWGLSGPFNVPGPPPLLRLPQVSRQKPPFAWLWNQPLGKQMRQQLDQLQRPSAHISVPGQARWHPAKLFWASLTAWSPSHVAPMTGLHGEASEGLEARRWPCQSLLCLS